VVGRTLSHFRVLEEIGRGGMGVVYRARDVRLDRDVALKVLPPEVVADADRKARFLREARAAAALSDPHIAVVHEVDEVDGVTFIAMELLRGEKLSGVLKRERLPLDRCLDLAAQIASGLAAAHAHGVVHRDLKPANVIVDEHGHAKLIDFGLAKLREAAVPAEDTAVAPSTSTAPGVVMGTVAYMSPEQARGLAVDARTDIWSLGVVLYELLGGRRPFEGATATDVLTAILRDAPPPVPERTPPPPPSIAAECARILDRCLAKDRDQRYQHVRDVALDLAAAQRQLRDSSRVAPPGRRTPGPARRRLAGTALVLAVLAAVVWLAVGRGRWGPAPALGFQERDWVLLASVENLTGDPELDRSLDAALAVGLQQSQYVNVVPTARVQEALRRMKLQDAARLDEGLACDVAQRLGAKGVVAAGISRVGQVYSLSLRLVDPGTRLAAVADSSQARSKDDVLPTLDGLVTRMRQRLGESLSRLSRTSRQLPDATTSSLAALKLYADADRLPSGGAAAELLEQAVALDPEFALAHAALGYRYYLTRERRRGEAHYARAMSLLERLTMRERLWIQASAEDSRGNREEAARRFEAYLVSYPDDARAWSRLGWTNMATLGRPEEAVTAFTRALALRPEDASAHVNLATCYRALRRSREAIRHYEEAFRLEPEETLGPFVNHEFGFTLVELGEIDRAREAFGRALAQADPERRARAHRSLGMLEMYRGRYAAARDQLREAVLLSVARGPSASELRNRALTCLAHPARAQRRARAAELRRIEALVARSSFSPEMLLLAGRLQARDRRVDEAARTLAMMRSAAKDVLANSPVDRSTRGDEAAIAVLEGEIALARGRPSEAVAHLERALRLQPRKVDALGPLAASYAALGRDDEASRQYERLIEEQPLGYELQEDYQRAHLELARVQARLGQAAKARAVAGRLLDRWKDADADLPLLVETRTLLERLGP
jgi:tetratricopeptide (TPR) repeat protein